jgi:hypothetical protein
VTAQWQWTAKREKADVTTLGEISSLKLMRDLRGLGYAYVVPAEGMAAVTGFTAFFVIDETSFSITANAGQRIAVAPGREPRWIVACTADPRTRGEHVAAVIFECGGPVVKWKRVAYGVDHNGSASIVNSTAFEWLCKSGGDAWQRDLAVQSRKTKFTVAAGAPSTGGAFIRTSAGLGDGALQVRVGVDKAGTTVCVVVAFEMDLARLRDVATEVARAEKSPEVVSLEPIDRRCVANDAIIDVANGLAAAVVADFARAREDRAFGEDAVAFLKRGGDVAPLVARVAAMHEASDFQMLCTFNFHGGPDDDLRRHCISLLSPSDPMLWVRLGTLYGLFEGGGARAPEPLPWHVGGLAWLTPLLYAGHGGQRFPADSPLKGKASFPSAFDVERVLVALGYPAHALVSGALEADLDHWRKPTTFCQLPDANAYVEKHRDVVDAALRSKVARRQIYVLEVLAYAGVNPALFDVARARLAKSKSKTVAQKLERWVKDYGGPLPCRFEPR